MYLRYLLTITNNCLIRKSLRVLRRYFDKQQVVFYLVILLYKIGLTKLLQYSITLGDIEVNRLDNN
jgi:hypothetical protein